MTDKVAGAPLDPPFFLIFFFSFGPPEPPFIFFSSIILLCSSLYFHCFLFTFSIIEGRAVVLQPPQLYYIAVVVHNLFLLYAVRGRVDRGG